MILNIFTYLEIYSECRLINSNIPCRYLNKVVEISMITTFNFIMQVAVIN